MRVCARACVVSSPWFRPVRAHVLRWLRGGRGPHARAVRGRDVHFTKVKALPEWLCQCKLLETLCVPRRRPAAVRVGGRAGAALLRVALPCRAPGRAARRWVRRRRRCRSLGAAEPRARMAGARGRPARGRGWPEPPGRGRTVGAQGRALHRDRGAAGGGRVAQPEDPVSAAAAALTRPRRCADARQAASGARA
jgi:hypothetical protein